MWRCLRKGKLVKDPIIDAWLQLMKNRALRSDFRVLTFNSSHYALLSQCENCPPAELTHWLLKNDCWSKAVWLFPLIYGGHCNILIIIPKSRIFLFMDGPHKEPPDDLLKQICALMESVKGDLDWSQWTFHQPTDYPVQHPMSNNCAIHVCAWTCVICTGQELTCQHKEMAKMRRLMAAQLWAAPEMEVDSSGGNCGDYDSPVRKSSTTWKDVTWSNRTPGCSRTLEYCASLIEDRGEL
ncbi:uncharacterized protein LOC135172713 isoform X2 [Diachasmimorpha longicaudata]